MRVALVLGASVGGIGTYVRDLAEYCVSCGDDVVVAGPRSTEERFDFSATGARFVPLAGTLKGLADLRTLRRVLGGADVVNSHGFKAAARTNLARAGRRGPRHVVTLHNAILATGMRARIAEVIERLAVRPADAVLGASADLVERAEELGARHAALVPVPAPQLPEPTRPAPEVRAGLAVADDEFLMLSVGRLAAQKPFSPLLDAVAALRADLPLKLVIAGEGPERAALAARIENEKLPVTLLGHRADIADLLAAADVFVLTSRWEARALVVQEALRAGVPVVATAVGGIPDLVADAARLVPWNDVRALTAAIRSVLTDPGVRDGLRAAGPIQAATWPARAEALAAARAWFADRTGRRR
jgi:glycosyltransferase involved in cell wall biosynthesis